MDLKEQGRGHMGGLRKRTKKRADGVIILEVLK